MVLLDSNMRIQDLMNFAATLADEFPAVRKSGRRLNERALQRYWVSSQARFNVWGARLRLATDQLVATDFQGRRFWTAWSPVFQELLVSDLTTRIWASLLYSLDDRLGLCEYSPVGRSVLRGHNDARQRVVNLILKGRRRGIGEAIRLEALQCGLERWTDLLLALASKDPATVSYSHDSNRYLHYVSLCQDGDISHLAIARSTLMAKMGDTVVIPSHVDLHLQLHAQIVAALDVDMKTPAAIVKSQREAVWEQRMLSLADETEMMIDRWFDPEFSWDDDSAAGDDG